MKVLGYKEAFGHIKRHSYTITPLEFFGVTWLGKLINGVVIGGPEAAYNRSHDPFFTIDYADVQFLSGYDVRFVTRRGWRSMIGKMLDRLRIKLFYRL